mgnify:CR=1 FL=1
MFAFIPLLLFKVNFKNIFKQDIVSETVVCTEDGIKEMRRELLHHFECTIETVLTEMDKLAPNEIL